MSTMPFEEPFNAPMDEATAQMPIAADRQSHRWSLPTRIGFRFAFCYLATYCFFNGNATIFEAFPVVGDKLQYWLALAFLDPAQWIAQHLFHVAPPGNAMHPTGSGDTAINYIALLILLTLSAVATVVWSLLDRKRPHYQTLSAWLRFLIRLTLGFGMVVYGMLKVFPLQMHQPTIMVLSEPFGMHSPMALLWNFIGMNPVYETICGSAELLGGLLLLFRRTALFGAMLTAFVVTNVLLYNLCFDVPVKLYAAHLLLLALFVTLPDMRQLFRFFWLHQPAAPTGVWVPPARRAWFRRTTIGIEIGFALLAVGGMLYEAVSDWHEGHPKDAIVTPLRGAWRLDAATVLDAGGKPVPHPVRSKDGNTFAELDIESAERAAFRDDANKLSYFTTKTNPGQHTVEFERDDKSKIVFVAVTPDPMHLTLTPTGAEARTASVMSFTRVSPIGGYPLLTRGFHWISEYPYQR